MSSSSSTVLVVMLHDDRMLGDGLRCCPCPRLSVVLLLHFLSFFLCLFHLSVPSLLVKVIPLIFLSLFCFLHFHVLPPATPATCSMPVCTHPSPLLRLSHGFVPSSVPTSPYFISSFRRPAVSKPSHSPFYFSSSSSIFSSVHPFLSHHRLTLCPPPLSSFCVHYLLWLSCLPSLSWSVPFICSRTIRPFYSFKQGKLLQGLVIVKVSPLCLPSQECTLTTHHRLITTPLPFHCHHVSTTALHQHLL